VLAISSASPRPLDVPVLAACLRPGKIQHFSDSACCKAAGHVLVKPDRAGGPETRAITCSAVNAPDDLSDATNCHHRAAGSADRIVAARIVSPCAERPVSGGRLPRHGNHSTPPRLVAVSCPSSPAVRKLVARRQKLCRAGAEERIAGVVYEHLLHAYSHYRMDPATPPANPVASSSFAGTTSTRSVDQGYRHRRPAREIASAGCCPEVALLNLPACSSMRY